MLQIEIFCRDGFGLSRSVPMCPASLWVLPRRSSRLCCSSRSTLVASSHPGPLESRSRFAWLCRERSCARQSLEKSALFRRLRRSMCSRHSGTINKKTRLSGADAVKHTAPPCTCGARVMRSKALPKRMVHPHKAHGRYGQTSVRLHMALSLFSSESMAVDTHAIRMKSGFVQEPYKGGFA